MIAECERRIADKNADKGWRMKRMVLMCMVLAGLLYSGPLAALENDGPRIEIKEMRHDFGKVVQGTPAECVFEIRNAGNAQLVIEKVQPS
ncbi:MAG: DUF1573 domain-containing protein [Nitrospirota bacterium]